MIIICGQLFIRDTIHYELASGKIWKAVKAKLLASVLLGCKTELSWIYVVRDRRT